MIPPINPPIGQVSPQVINLQNRIDLYQLGQDLFNI